MKDRASRGRYIVQGEDVYMSRLTDEQVMDIRKSYAQGNINQQELAEKYGVTFKNISAIVLGKTWKHLEVLPQNPEWKQGKVKLDVDKVRSIRAMFTSGVTVKELAKQFNISDTQIRFIVQRKTWRSVA